MTPKKEEQPGDGGFSNPDIYATLEEAVAAGTAEERWLDSLDQPTEDDSND